MAMVTASRFTGGCHRDAAAQFQLADIWRGASLSDVRVDVTVAHTRSRLRARFFVEMAHVDPISGEITSGWNFGIAMSEVKAFETRLLRVVRRRRCITIDRDARGRTTTNKLPLFWKKIAGCDDCCATCDDLRRAVKRWEKLSRLEAIGKWHMDAKCTLVTRFFYRVFTLVHTRAQWLRDCALLREVLRMIEELGRVQFTSANAAFAAIKSLKRVPSLTRISSASTVSAAAAATGRSSAANEECTICLSSLHELRHDNIATSSSQLSEGVPVREGVELGCGHRFHDTCLCLWFHTRVTCPVCRAPASG